MPPEEQKEQQKRGPKGPWKFTEEFIEELATKLEQYTEANPLPIWSDFCYNHKLHRQIAQDLCAKSQKFSDAYERMMGRQEGGLIKAGISGKGNSSFITFIMKNNHGYKDRTDVAHSGADQFLEGLVQRAAARKAKKEKQNG
jgi:hypothetical protein